MGAWPTECAQQSPFIPGVALSPRVQEKNVALSTSATFYCQCYQCVQEKNVAVIDEDGLFSLVAAAPAPEGMDVEEAAPEDSWDAVSVS